MISKHFDKNKNGKIEFTEKELKELLDEVYNSGRNDGLKTDYGFWWNSPWYSLNYNSPYDTNKDWTITTAYSDPNNDIKYSFKEGSEK